MVSKLVCSLVGTLEKVTLLPGSLTRSLYQEDEALEQFACNYGLNPLYRDQLIQGELRVSALGPEGEVRAIELPAHRFFLATLYLPQVSSAPGRPHPLILAYLSAARHPKDPLL